MPIEILGQRICYGKHKRAIIWAGYPLSGKDTHSDPFGNIGFEIFKTGEALKKMAVDNPDNPAFEPIRRRKLVDSSLIMHAAKRWIFERRKLPMIHLNGMPRKVDQIEIVDFLKKRGFDPMVVWFTTPKKECMKRPCRPGREDEDSPRKRADGMQTFDDETLPMLHLLMEDYHIRTENGNLLLMDNTHKDKEQTCSEILKFLGLPFNSNQLFPRTDKEKKEQEMAISKPPAPKKTYRPSRSPVAIPA